MKRWTSTWAALLFAGVLATPSIGFAQPPAEPAAPTATTEAKTAQATPQEHLQQADAALKSISTTAVTGKAKSQIADLKKRVSSLEKMTEANAASAEAKPDATKWASEAAAADKILGQLLAESPSAGATATATAEPKPTGTSGTMPSKASEAVGLDDETKAKLASVRKSLNAFAAAMSGGASAPAASASPSAASPTSTAAPATSSAPTTTPAEPSPAEPSPATPSPASPAPASPAPAPTTPPAPTSPASPTPTQPTEPTPTEPTPPSTTPAQPTTTPAQPPTSTPPAEPPAAAAPADASAKPTVNADAAKQALTAARESLSQMTQLPAAQQLTGESRTQVSQLISSFNELITTNSEWKASYAKVDANLTSLIGAQTSDESPAAPTAGAAGAVGTSGTGAGSLDAGIKAKLLEFRTHLKEFEKAAGGATPK